MPHPLHPGPAPPTNIQSLDFAIYRKAVQAALEPLFETDSVLRKVRHGESIQPEELDRLNSLLHTRNPDVNLATLREFYPDTAVPLSRILRAIVGLEPEAVEARVGIPAARQGLRQRREPAEGRGLVGSSLDASYVPCFR